MKKRLLAVLEPAAEVTKRKLAIYARVSTLHRQDKGLQAQQRALHDYVAYKQIEPKDVIEFSDEMSGMKKSRPGFDAMMARVRAGEVHTVMVYSFSRFARSMKQLIDSLEEFEKAGIDFVSLSENIDTKGPVGKLIFRIFAALAEFERDQLSERTKLGLRNAVAKGKILGAPKHIQDGEIRKLHSEGMPISDIGKKLGVSRASIYRALKKPA